MVYPDAMMVGERYKITEPVYDDFDEGIEEETDLVEVINRIGNKLILKSIEHGFTYERDFQYLKECKIEKDV